MVKCTAAIFIDMLRWPFIVYNFQGIIIVHFIIGGKGVVRLPKKKVI